MISQIEKYDEALLLWLDQNFRQVVPDKQLQILFAPPDRPYAEVESGRVTDKRTLRLPRISVSRQDYTFVPDRQNPTTVRYCGVTSLAKTSMCQANYPIPIDLPYQLDFWTEYETELQAYIAFFMRQLHAGIKYITVFINNLWQNKITPFHLEGTIVNGTEPEPGGEFREIRATVPLRAEAFLYDEEASEVPVIREIVVNVKDYDTQVQMEEFRVAEPYKIGEGTGGQLIFTGTLPNRPVKKPSVVVFSTVSGAEVRGYDDGDTGGILGDGVSGLVDYVTGGITLTFTNPPDNGAGVYAESQEES